MYEQKEKKDKKERKKNSQVGRGNAQLSRWRAVANSFKTGSPNTLLFPSLFSDIIRLLFKNSPFQMHKLIHLLVLKLD